MSLPPTGPPAEGRMRVRAPRTIPQLAHETTVLDEVAEQSAVGEVMVRSLIRSQLRLAVVVAAGFLAALFLCWALMAWLPSFSQWRILGVPAPWLLLGVGIHPLIAVCAWLYVRAAAKNENRYRDLVAEE
ncbi:hypothetical protein ACFUCV_00575 [Specibacter sp. NPDC057265]|uniref:hypothetical protein n=1 Tax=Specibacter sp. NPDC057265 TaxID=3346075 RepID=UPI00362B87D2